MKWIATALCMLASAVSIASAQSRDPYADAPITVLMEPIQFPPRTGTFYPVSCKISNRTSGIWEGSLRIRQIEELPSDFEFVIPDLVVGSTPLEFLVTLPPIRPNVSNQQTELLAEAVEKTGKVTELPKVQLISHTSNVRTLTFGICVTDGIRGIPADLNPLMKPLQLFNDGSVLTQDGRTIRIALPNFVARDLSENPHEYIRFDGLLLAKLSFEQIRPRQFAALETWIKSGGSLGLVLPQSIDSEHLELLNQLIAPGSTRLRGEPDLGLIAEPPLQSYLVTPHGLGQVVLIPENYLTEHATDLEELQRLAQVLWRTRSNFKTLVNVFNSPFDQHNWQRMQTPSRVPMSVPPGAVALSQIPPTPAPYSGPDTNQVLWEILRPKNMGIIPFQFLILALIVYVILIGPGDYFLLGWLKARRLTWIVFPLVTIGFSWGMLKITNTIMGNNQQVRKIRIIDLDESGIPFRENEISLLMFSTPKQIKLDIADGYSVRLQPNSAGFNSPGWDSRRWSTQRAAYVGRIPGRYSLTFNAEQWTPDNFRTTRLKSSDAVPAFPWGKYNGSNLLRNDPTGGALLAEFQKDLEKSFGSSVLAFIHDGQSIRPPIILKSMPPDELSNYFSLTHLLQLTPHAESAWLRRVSPQCADSYEDLALLEADDTRHWAVGIVVPQGDQLLFYRILMNREKEPSSPETSPSETPKPVASPPAAGTQTD